ncbi:hypothetical protein GGI43DRAFT_391644 [Trichoderma evansii]
MLPSSQSTLHSGAPFLIWLLSSVFQCSAIDQHHPSPSHDSFCLHPLLHEYNCNCSCMQRAPSFPRYLLSAPVPWPDRTTVVASKTPGASMVRSTCRTPKAPAAYPSTITRACRAER